MDHGKSTLVRALTGTNPDRWLEEQLRGMTLDLGFAHLKYVDGLEAGIIDVPGHERFLHNMLAGAAGMELLLLVIAANEGPRPQTFEHLAIVQYLNVQRVIVVLTKADLLQSDELEFAHELVKEQLRDTIAHSAPVISVSVHAGTNIDRLRDCIAQELRRLSRTDDDALAYLPIDRVFALPGHGTIVTGTLMQGSIQTGDQLMLAPSGRSVRVRGLQVFNRKKARVSGGSRIAVNISSVDVSEISRGETLASPELKTEQQLSVLFTPMPGAAAILRRRTPIRMYLGSAEVLGTLVCNDVRTSEETFSATVHLRRRVIAFAGQRFVVRRVSPKSLLGGGVIGGQALPSLTHADAQSAATTQRVAGILRESGCAPLGSGKVAERVNLREAVVLQALEELCTTGEATMLSRPVAYMHNDALADVTSRTIDALNAQQKAAPWVLGTTSLALARKLHLAEPLLVRILAVLSEEAKIVHRAGYYATLNHVPRFTAEQRTFFEREVRADPSAPFLPASLPDVVARIEASRITGLSQAFDTLIGKAILVKVGDALYTGTQLAQIRAKLEAAVRKEGEITMARFRDLIGTSRKYAVPLLEWFDATGVTVRAGDVRKLRARSAPLKPQTSSGGL
ncbi:MAG: selenocysteine-specific translation elongation factor [Candidatus Eremiobacteraeota bacterium]|nr:selenocysteine-specific translation elongation factor [Candidatus Eremiobacteraeota bacterium]